MAKRVIISNKAPKALGPYSHGTEVDGLLFLSGMLGIHPTEGKLAVGVEAQARQSLENIKSILKGEGLSLNHVLKTTIFLSEIKDFGTVNAIYSQYFTSDFPARSCVAVKELPLAALVEIEVIASRK
jgi:2-iminobutanoate/2-iminopropanoate deaminase